ncbi:MAG: hypothetical protein H8F28_01920 [Fibrella sp.]|nr:hypothetical protein [Armatimonadota bacterium]
MPEDADSREWRRRRKLASELYRQETVRVVVLGEAPPPERFFYFGDSLFFRYLMRAFVPFVGESFTEDAGRFLSLYRALGGWRTDVCEDPQRASKGGADDVGICLDRFLVRWSRLPFAPEPLVILSPKRLYDKLPNIVKAEVTGMVPPPGQWNAHRVAFLREMERLLRVYVGHETIADAARSVDVEDAVLDFEIARACAEGAEASEILRLITGHPREARLRFVWENNEDET